MSHYWLPFIVEQQSRPVWVIVNKMGKSMVVNELPLHASDAIRSDSQGRKDWTWIPPAAFGVLIGLLLLSLVFLQSSSSQVTSNQHSILAIQAEVQDLRLQYLKAVQDKAALCSETAVVGLQKAAKTASEKYAQLQKEWAATTERIKTLQDQSADLTVSNAQLRETLTELRGKLPATDSF